MGKICAIGTSPGIAIGTAYWLKQSKNEINPKPIPEELVEEELAALEQAIARVRDNIAGLVTETSSRAGVKQGEIFKAQAMLLDDPEFIPHAREKIESEKINAAAAVDLVIQKHAAAFADIENEYIRARIADLHDVASQVIRQLNGCFQPLPCLGQPSVIFAKDLTPSETATFDLSVVLAFVTAAGSETSHTSIIARSLGIPAVVGAGEELQAKVKPGDQVVVDGGSGVVIVNPSPAQLAEYNERREEEIKIKKQLESYRYQPAITRDGYRVTVAGNVGCLADLERLSEQEPEGIGLFRTEFLYMGRDRLPTEKEQLAVYEETLRKMKGKPVIIRTLDVGGDKEIPYLNLPVEANPFLGNRAIRLYFERPDIYKPQLRAILRASCSGDIKIMLPMVASPEEFKKGRHIIEGIKKELRDEGYRIARAVALGVMIETPAAALIADVLAKEVDFFSIGTNDLVQYTLAVDRTNETVAHLSTHYHPAVLRLISSTVKFAHAGGIHVGICGEAAADRLFQPFLIGLGVDELSVSSSSVLLTKEAVRKCVRGEAVELAVKLLRLKSAAEVKEVLAAFNS